MSKDYQAQELGVQANSNGTCIVIMVIDICGEAKPTGRGDTWIYHIITSYVCITRLLARQTCGRSRQHSLSTKMRVIHLQ
ncbi:hypothetical protein Bca4012_067188 [Brassica carinata]